MFFLIRTWNAYVSIEKGKNPEEIDRTEPTSYVKGPKICHKISDVSKKARERDICSSCLDAVFPKESEEINNLPPQTNVQKGLLNPFLSKCCSLVDAITQTRVVETACNHLFHLECLERWLNVNDTCPICRYVAPLETIRTHYDLLAKYVSEQNTAEIKTLMGGHELTEEQLKELTEEQLQDIVLFTEEQLQNIMVSVATDPHRPEDKQNWLFVETYLELANLNIRNRGIIFARAAYMNQNSLLEKLIEKEIEPKYLGAALAWFAYDHKVKFLEKLSLEIEDLEKMKRSHLKESLEYLTRPGLTKFAEKILKFHEVQSFLSKKDIETIFIKAVSHKNETLGRYFLENYQLRNEVKEWACQLAKRKGLKASFRDYLFEKAGLENVWEALEKDSRIMRL